MSLVKYRSIVLFVIQAIKQVSMSAPQFALWLLFALCLHAPLAKAQKTQVSQDFNTTLNNAYLLLDHKKYAQARDAFEACIRMDPNASQRAEWTYQIAHNALLAGQKDAESLFDAFLADYPEHSRAHLAYFEMGNYYYNTRDLDKAIAYFSKGDLARLPKPKDDEARFKLGYCYFAKKDFDKAAPWFDQAKKTKHPYTYSAAYYSGYIRFRNGQYGDAIVDLRLAAEGEEFKFLVPHLITSAYYRDSLYNEVIAYSKPYLTESAVVKRDDILLLTADSYFRNENWAQAREVFKLLETSFPSRIEPQVRYQMAYACYRLKDFQSSADYLQPLASGSDSLAQNAAYLLGVNYIELKQPEYAWNALRHASFIPLRTPVYQESLFHFGKVSYELKRYAEAITSLHLFLKEFPKTGRTDEAQTLLSESYLGTKNYAEAISFIESLPYKNPRIRSAQQSLCFFRGIELYNKSDYKGANQYLGKAIDNPMDRRILGKAAFWYGESLSRQNEWEEALNFYAKAFQNLEPDDAEYQKARYGIGYAYFNTEKYDRADDHFEYIISKSSNVISDKYRTEAYARLGDVRFMAKKYPDAITYYDKALTRGYVEPDYLWYQKGLIYVLTNKMEAADNAFYRVVKQCPHSMWVHLSRFQLGQINLEDSRYKEAIEHFTVLIEAVDPNEIQPFAYLKRAICYSNTDNAEKAITDYKTILERYPAHPEVAKPALLGLQELLSKLNRSEEFDPWLATYKEAHPSDGDIVDIEFQRGMNLYSKPAYAQSAAAFGSFLAAHPEHAKAGEARYYRAEAVYRSGKLDSAQQFYEVVLEDKNLYFNRALGRLGEIAVALQDYPACAARGYQLLGYAQSRKDKMKAQLLIVQGHAGTGQLDSALIMYETIFAENPANSEVCLDAALYMGKAFQKANRFPEALDAYVQVVNGGSGDRNAKARYEIASIQYQQKRFKESLETLFQLNEANPSQTAWINKSFLLIADNYIALEAFFQAEATLQSIIDRTSDQAIVKEAQERLTKLKMGREEGIPNE
jgi:tetratricopeptide (TPR) repeat protein